MKTCAIVAASDFNAGQFKEMDTAGMFDIVLAVDAGFAHLEDVGRKPDMVVGDFDSLGYVPRGVRTAKFSTHKDKSDMELALERAKAMKATSIYAFGALGGRLDHTVANMQVLAKASEKGASVCAIGLGEAVFFLTGPDTFEAEAREGGTVSVFALNDKVEGLFERGMEWDLDDVELTNRSSWGLSNELKGEPVMIGVEAGTIAIFYPL